MPTQISSTIGATQFMLVNSLSLAPPNVPGTAGSASDNRVIGPLPFGWPPGAAYSVAAVSVGFGA